jgi:hypothetical protein
VARALSEHKAGIDSRGNAGETALHIASGAHARARFRARESSLVAFNVQHMVIWLSPNILYTRVQILT